MVERARRTVEFHLIECIGPWLKGVPCVETKKEISVNFSFQKVEIHMIECQKGLRCQQYWPRKNTCFLN